MTSAVGIDLDVKTIGRYVLILIGIVVLAFIILKVKGMFTSEIKNQKNIAQANAEIDANKLSFTEAQYASLASKLYAAMKGLGTDEQAIFDVMATLKTRSDLMKLMSVFGVRDNKTLMEWIPSELSAKDMAKLNNILMAQSIVFTF